jgi:hypothetical protein
MWRMVNTYVNRNPYKEHAHKGQLSKARKARNLAIDDGVCVQPVELKRDGFLMTGRRYIDQGETIQDRFKTAQRRLRKRREPESPPYVHLQEKARPHAPAFALWELYDDKLDVQQTRVHERDYAAEYLPAFQSLLSYYRECLRWTGLPPDVANMPIRRFGGWTKNVETISVMTPLLTTRSLNCSKLRQPHPKIPDSVIAQGIKLGGVISKSVGCCPESGWRRV